MADGHEIIGGGVIAALAAFAGYAGRWIEAWFKAQPSKKDLLTAAGELAQGLMEGMREDLDALRGEVKALKSSHAECEERCTALTGEVRALQSFKISVEQLRAGFRDPAATNPGGALEGAIIEMAGGEIGITPRDTLTKRNT